MRAWGTLRDELPELLRTWEQHAQNCRDAAYGSDSNELAMKAIATACAEMLAVCARDLQVYLDNCNDVPSTASKPETEDDDGR